MHEFFFARYCTNGSFHIKDIGFHLSYSPVAYTDSSRINIADVNMNRLTDRILDISNAFQNTNGIIYARVCDITPPFYLD